MTDGEKMLDKDWRMNNLYKIINREQERVKFGRNKKQRH